MEPAVREKLEKVIETNLTFNYGPEPKAPGDGTKFHFPWDINKKF